MRINQIKRIYMNEADSGSGNGAQPAAAAPAEPTAAPTAPVFDPDALVSRLMGALDEKLAAHTNATNAALRKAGVFKQDKPSVEHPAPTPAPQQAPGAPTPISSTGLSMADVEALLERKGTVASRAAKYGLSDAQTKRFEAAMSGVSRESLATEADAYLADMGLAKAVTQPVSQSQSQATPPAQAPKPNISDRGTAAPADLRDSEGVINSRPLEATKHDVDALMLKHGEYKGLQMFAERINAALRGVRLESPNGGRRQR